MSMFGKLADRLLATVAPTTGVDAACIIISSGKNAAGYCKDGTTRYRHSIFYDNCAPKVWYSCTAR
jgi:hypothetical protein